MTPAEAIVAHLKDFGHNRPNSYWSELDSDTVRLIRGNPFALLVAVAFDRGMPWQKAWQIPAEINQKGFLDPKLLASKSEAELVELLNSLPFLPRYGAQQGARTLSEATRLADRSALVPPKRTRMCVLPIDQGVCEADLSSPCNDFWHRSGPFRQ